MSAPRARTSSDDGLQAERTALSWSRTSLGFLANGALLLLRDAQHHATPLRLAPAGLFVMLAVAVHLVARRRRQRLAHRPLPRPLAARSAVMLIGCTMAGLVSVTAAVLIPV